MRSGISQEIVIIGGGVTGVASAYELARAGAAVTVVEQASLASMASGRTLAGVRQSGRHAAELPLAMAAVARWKTLGDELGADLEYRQDGNLRLAEDEVDRAKILTIVGEQSRLGLEIEFLDGNAAVREIAPAVAQHVRAASYTPTDGHANPNATVDAYAQAARNAGARIREQSRVQEIETRNGRIAGIRTDNCRIPADTIVIAAGIDTPALLAPLGLDLPLHLANVPVVQTTRTRPLLAPVIGTAKAHFAARQEAGGAMRFSSGGHPVEPGADAKAPDLMRPSVARLAETMSRAASLLPAIGGLPVNAVWGGLIDLTPDSLPVIDRVSEIEGLVVAAGFSGHGFCLGPVSGEIVRDLVLARDQRYRIEPFRWGRFVARNGTDSPELFG